MSMSKTRFSKPGQLMRIDAWQVLVEGPSGFAGLDRCTRIFHALWLLVMS